MKVSGKIKENKMSDEGKGCFITAIITFIGWIIIALLIGLLIGIIKSLMGT
jgi:hypothetical protein